MPQPAEAERVPQPARPRQLRDGALTYLLAVALAILAVALTRWLETPLAGVFFSLPLVAVAISGSLGSVRSAIVTAGLSAVGMAVLQQDSVVASLRHTVATYRFIEFVAMSALVAWVSGSRSLAYRREQEARREGDEARRRAEIAVRDAERLSNLQEQVMAIVGHDLRTPLSAIRLTSAALLQRADVAELHRRQLERISASSGRMARMISDLVDFGRIRRGMSLPLQRRPTDLSVICRTAIAELQQVYPDRPIVLDAAHQPVCDGDPHRLLQVVSNLLGNALQHGSTSEPVQLAIAGDAAQVVLRIRNHGTAIPPDVLPFIFEPFRRGGTGLAGEASDRGSVGLGLFIVRQIVATHGGTVEVVSEEGAGTTFTVTLPAAPAAADAAAAAPRSLG